MDTVRSLHITAICLVLLLLAACAATPLPELPADDVPVAWERAAPDADVWPNLDWWNNFESDELRSVIALVEERNFDLANNERNLRLAQLALRDAGFDMLPTPVVEIGGSGNYFGVNPVDGMPPRCFRCTGCGYPESGAE